MLWPSAQSDRKVAGAGQPPQIGDDLFAIEPSGGFGHDGPSIPKDPSEPPVVDLHHLEVGVLDLPRHRHALLCWLGATLGNASHRSTPAAETRQPPVGKTRWVRDNAAPTTSGLPEALLPICAIGPTEALTDRPVSATIGFEMPLSCGPGFTLLPWIGTS